MAASNRSATLVGIVVAVSALLTFPSRCDAQIVSDSDRLGLYTEMLDGNAMVVLCCSLNADWKVSRHASIRVGAGGAVFTDDNTPLVSTFVMVNRLIGGNGKYLELGAGFVRSNSADVASDVPRVGPTVAVALRLQKGGKIFRVAFTPMLPPFAGRWEPGSHFLPRFGISRGISF